MEFEHLEQWLPGAGALLLEGLPWGWGAQGSLSLGYM